MILLIPPPVGINPALYYNLVAVKINSIKAGTYSSRKKAVAVIKFLQYLQIFLMMK